MGSYTAQGTEIQYQHEISFNYLNKGLKFIWNDGAGYEVSIGNSDRFEFNEDGELVETIFKNNKYSFDETSTPCNVPEGVSFTSGVVESQGSDELPYNCNNCYTAMDNACSYGVQQICDYSPGVSENSPSTFNKRSRKKFSMMCEYLYASCEFGRIDVECDMRCSDTEVPVLEPSTCPAQSSNYLGCKLMPQIVFEDTHVAQDPMNSQICNSLCIGWEFYATFKGDICRCASNLLSEEFLVEGSCNTQCNGTPEEFCGGNNLAVSLYGTYTE